MVSPHKKSLRRNCLMPFLLPNQQRRVLKAIEYCMDLSREKHSLASLFVGPTSEGIIIMQHSCSALKFEDAESGNATHIHSNGHECVQ